MIPYLPREHLIKENECLGAQSPYSMDIESDIEESDDEEIDHKAIFFQEIKETIERCLVKKIS